MSEPRLSDQGNTKWQRWHPDQLEEALPLSVLPPAPSEDVVAPDPESCSSNISPLSAQVEATQESLQQPVTSDATEETTACRENGYKEGYDVGYADGRKDGIEAAQREAKQFLAMTNACAQALSRLDDEVSEALTELALSIARQVVRSTLDVRPEIIIGLVKDMLALTEEHPTLLTLRMHPDDIKLIQTHLAPTVSDERLRFVEDSSMERGGCMATSVLGDIDAMMSTRWRRALTSLGSGSKEWGLV